MVVCKFFMNGYCKFGDNCRYEHIRGGSDDRNGNNRLHWTNPNQQSASHYHHQQQQQQQFQSSTPASVFSFNKATQSLSNKGNTNASTFSFNRAANHLNQQQFSTTNFSFGNTLAANNCSNLGVQSQTNQGTSSFSFFTNQPQQQPRPTPASASGFSFTQAFRQIQQPSRPGLIVYDDVMDDEMGAPPLAAPSTTSFFGDTTTMSNNSLGTTSPNKSSFFSNQPSSNSTAFNSQLNSFFGNTATDTSLKSSSTSSSFFGGANIGQNNSVTKGYSIDSEIYSQMEKISNDDRYFFEADQFVNRIPLCPPPYQLCF